jgi:hypothetical protein
MQPPPAAPLRSAASPADHGPRARAGAWPATAALQADERGRFGDYVNDVIGFWAIVGIVGRSAFDQVQEDPESWGDDTEGFGKRVASNAGRRFVQESVHHGLAYMLGRSTDYQPCGCTSLGGRLGNSFVEAVTDRDDQGNRAFSISQFAGNYAGAFAPALWMPDEDWDAGKAALNGTTAFIFTAAGNFLLTEVLGFGR